MCVRVKTSSIHIIVDWVGLDCEEKEFHSKNK